jgi:hypothetical protein
MSRSFLNSGTLIVINFLLLAGHSAIIAMVLCLKKMDKNVHFVCHLGTFVSYVVFRICVGLKT